MLRDAHGTLFVDERCKVCYWVQHHPGVCRRPFAGYRVRGAAWQRDRPRSPPPAPWVVLCFRRPRVRGSAGATDCTRGCCSPLSDTPALARPAPRGLQHGTPRTTECAPRDLRASAPRGLRRWVGLPVPGTRLPAFALTPRPHPTTPRALVCIPKRCRGSSRLGPQPQAPRRGCPLPAHPWEGYMALVRLSRPITDRLYTPFGGRSYVAIGAPWSCGAGAYMGRVDGFPPTRTLPTYGPSGSILLDSRATFTGLPLARVVAMLRKLNALPSELSRVLRVL